MLKNRIISTIVSVSLIMSALTGCVRTAAPAIEDVTAVKSTEVVVYTSAESAGTAESTENTGTTALYEGTGIAEWGVPDYSGEAYAVVNSNVPFFDIQGAPTEVFEEYAELDDLGRCGAAWACVGQETMPTEERGKIGMIKPTGWHTVKYDNVDGKYLYNRCHLIGYQLTGENANERNLITGTRYLNVEGMLLFENEVADYVQETANHVLYRVTPIYSGNDLLAKGVLIEAYSVEDEGAGICFNVYCYNVQPDIYISYADGLSENRADNLDRGITEADTNSETVESTKTQKFVTTMETIESETENKVQEITYVLNTSTKKFHKSSCSSVDKMTEDNKELYTGNREDVIAMGYDPCKRCYP